MKVEIRKIEGYQLTELEPAISEYLSVLRSKPLAKRKRIMIKPNCLGAYTPDKAVTTHPAVLEAIIIYLLRLKKEVWIGDSPGGSVNIEQMWENTGLRDLADRYPVKLINLNTYKFREYDLDGMNIKLSQAIWDCDGIINVAKYKTHSLTAYTGAVKNLYGLIPGLIKSEYHKEYPDTGSFSDLLNTIYGIVKDRIIFNIIDGIEGMDGAGPSAGRVCKFDLLFGSPSASAVDFAASGIMGFKLDDIPYLAGSLHKDGILPSRIDIPRSFLHYRLPGVDINTVKYRSGILKFVPPVFGKALKLVYDMYPQISDRCIKCGICVKSCPVSAIAFQEDGFPLIKRSACIKCMCCHELCPHHAVDIYVSPLARLLSGLW